MVHVQLNKTHEKQVLSEALREEPFTLVLSAGFFGFFAHVGFLQALEELELRPQAIIGVSAGALAGGLWSSGMSADELEAELRSLSRDKFWDPGLPIGGLLKGLKFDRLLRDLFNRQGVSQIEDCPIPFQPVAYDILEGRTVGLEKGDIVKGVRASCAMPVLFRPVRIGWRWYVDGGLHERTGLSFVEQGVPVALHYLAPRSPWSKPRRASLDPSQVLGDRPGLVIDSLPRLGPFRLGMGGEAISIARRVSRKWLAAPARPGLHALTS